MWDSRVLFAGLRTPDPYAPQLPRMYRLLLLEEITARLRAPFPGARSITESRDTLLIPPADSRYSALVLMSGVRFVVYGDGTLGQIRIRDTTRLFGLTSPGDSLFAEDVRRALDAMAAERAIIPIPDREPADSAELLLFVHAGLPRTDSISAAWPLFSLIVPRAKPAALREGGALRYPKLPGGGRGFEAMVWMRFEVTPDGRADPETIRDPRRPGDIPGAYELEYQSFLVSVRKAIHGSRYWPAEVLGCRVRQSAQQSFIFSLRRRR